MNIEYALLILIPFAEYIVKEFLIKEKISQCYSGNNSRKVGN